jgi:hypothetical protein
MENFKKYYIYGYNLLYNEVLRIPYEFVLNNNEYKEYKIQDFTITEKERRVLTFGLTATALVITRHIPRTLLYGLNFAILFHRESLFHLLCWINKKSTELDSKLKS